ncbi:hypothetical protein [Lactococcus garvieae]|uniref:hypothetical protein n=1 Tax=Lactococcus garvieae TaxID=1363 RepID=UPI00254E69A1|nr:hypothetical protein [Lactococcus garvieae]
MNEIRKKIIYSFTVLIGAYGYWGLTITLFFHFGEERKLEFLIMNFISILFFLSVDKIEYLTGKRIFKQYQKDKNCKSLRRWNTYFSNGSTLKSSLYFFYIFASISQGLISVEPNFPFLGNLATYFEIVYYGIFVLVAVDKFIQQIYNDLR